MATGIAAAADSGGYRGPNHDGIHPETGLLKTWPAGGPKLLWTFPPDPAKIMEGEEYPMLGKPGQRSDPSKLALCKDEPVGVGMGYSCVVTAGEAIYATGMHFDLGKKPTYATCLGLDGSLKWKTKLDRGLTSGRFEGPRCTPVVDPSGLYFESGNGIIYALNHRTGAKRWSVDTRTEFNNAIPGWGYNISPLVDDKQVIVPMRRAKHLFVSLNKSTGKPLWTTTCPDTAIVDSSPVFARAGKTTLIACSFMQATVFIDAADGKVVYKSPQAGANSLTPVAHKEHLLLFAGGQLRLWKLKPDGAGVEEVWQAGGVNALCQAVVLGERVFVVQGQALVSLDFKTGRRVANLAFSNDPRCCWNPSGWKRWRTRRRWASGSVHRVPRASGCCAS